MVGKIKAYTFALAFGKEATEPTGCGAKRERSLRKLIETAKHTRERKNIP